MKKIAAFLLIFFVFNSCSDDVTFNEVAFQALKNNVLWKSSDFKAYLNTDGSLTLIATSQQESLIIDLDDSVKGNYYFSPISVSTATFITFVDGQESAFISDQINDYGENDDMISGDGTLNIVRNDGNTVSGTFSLTLVNEDDQSDERKVDFTKGNFNNIPIIKQ